MTTAWDASIFQGRVCLLLFISCVESRWGVTFKGTAGVRPSDGAIIATLENEFDAATCVGERDRVQLFSPFPSLVCESSTAREGGGGLGRRKGGFAHRSAFLVGGDRALAAAGSRSIIVYRVYLERRGCIC